MKNHLKDQKKSEKSHVSKRNKTIVINDEKDDHITAEINAIEIEERKIALEERKLKLKQSEIDLKYKELEIKKMEMEMEMNNK